MFMEENKEVVEIKKMDNTEKTETPQTKREDKKGFSIASMVLGIISLVFCFVWIISIPCAILAIIFGILGIKSTGKGMSIAGLVTSGIGIIISFVIFALLIVVGMSAGLHTLESFDDIYNSYYDDYDYDYDSYYDSYDFDDYYDSSNSLTF